MRTCSCVYCDDPCYQKRIDAHRNVKFYGGEMRQERIRSCQAVTDEAPRCGCSSRLRHIEVVRPLCCYADCRQLLVILALVALIYSIIALVLTCIYSPRPFTIVTLAFSIITMLTILCGVVTAKTIILKISLFLSVLLSILIGTGAVLLAINTFHYFGKNQTWETNTYLISLFVVYVLFVIYSLSLVVFIVKVLAFYRENNEDEQRVETTVRYRRN